MIGSNRTLIEPETIGCEVDKRCTSKLKEEHHNPPKSWWDKAGIPFQGVMHKLCPNRHQGQVHVAIDDRVKNGTYTKPYPKKVIMIADEAFDIAAQFGLIPALTL